MSFLKKIFYSFACMVFPQLLFAADKLDILNPPPIQFNSDLSIGYLGDIFGVVDGVLHGGGTQIMGHMFAIFNAGSLFVGAIVLAYTIIVGTLHSAGEGEFLGRKWSSIWIPIRTVLGILLLLPRATGYSTLQVMVMWVIVQGVGLADSIWISALSYVSDGNNIVQMPVVQNPNVVMSMSNVFRSEVCMFTLENALSYSYQQSEDSTQPSSLIPPTPSTPLNTQLVPLNPVQPMQPVVPLSPSNALSPPAPDFLNTIVPLDVDSQKVLFPGQIKDPTYSGLTGICGAMTWVNAYKGSAGEQLEQLKATRSVALQQVLLALAGPAKALADAILPSNFSQSAIDVLANKYDLTQPLTGNVNGGFVQYLMKIEGLVPSLSPTIFTDTTEDYEQLMIPALQRIVNTNSSQISTQLITQMVADGWLLAGSFYWDIASMGSTQASDIAAEGSFQGTGTMQNIANALNDPKSGVKAEFPAYAQGNIHQLLQLFGPDSPYEPIITALVNYSNYYISQKSDNSGPTTGSMLFWDATGWAGLFSESKSNAASLPGGLSAGVGLITGIISGMLDSTLIDCLNFAKLANAQNNGVNPVGMLATIGGNLISTSVIMWLVAASLTTSIAAAISLVPCITSSVAILTAASFMVPFLGAISLIFFTLGCVQSYYIPLIPMITFTFSAIGWFIAVIEAMVAAPLVALGVLHPEGGNEVMGRAESGLMLLLSVFLTPSMMIIGLITGIIMSYVGVWILNISFWNVILSQMSIFMNGAAWGFAVPAVLLIYTYLVMAVMNQAFSLIHVIPDKVMRWIGAPSGVGIGESTREALGQAKEAAQSFGKDMGAGIKAGAEQAGENRVKLKNAKEKSEEVTTIDGSSKPGKGGGTSTDNTVQIAKQPPGGGG